MSREIKFRAWNETTGVMVPWEDLILEKSEGNNFYLIGHKESKAWIRYDHKQHLLQYTGLKDKNGVEIYEGDLVEHDDEFDGVWSAYEASIVVYDENYAQFCFEWDASNFLVDYRNLNVIGNIYENPELLKER